MVMELHRYVTVTVVVVVLIVFHALCNAISCGNERNGTGGCHVVSPSSPTQVVGRGPTGTINRQAARCTAQHVTRRRRRRCHRRALCVPVHDLTPNPLTNGT